jgi:hypothetical protein
MIVRMPLEAQANAMVMDCVWTPTMTSIIVERSTMYVVQIKYVVWEVVD